MRGINFLLNVLSLALLFTIILSINSLAICSDTDSGIDYYTKGEVTSNNETLIDYCTQSILVEYYCDSTHPDKILNTIHSCQEGCGGGSCGGVDEELPIIIPPYNGTENDTNYTPGNSGSGPSGNPNGNSPGIGSSPSNSGTNNAQQTTNNSDDGSKENTQEQTQKSPEPSILSPKKMKSYQNILLIIIGTIIGILVLSLFVISAIIKKGKSNNK
jgi:hypothetical protein